MEISTKRAMDVVLALLGLIIGAPLIAVIALLVRLDSPGKAIFSQRRLGLHGCVFRMHKFRKFPDNWGTKGATVTVAADVRMTRLGRFLERTKLDELPQLWNILVGEMSFVGPRPETVNFKDLFLGEFARVHDYVPGIFGPNQVAFRNESHLYPPDQDPETFYREQLFPRKARNDLEYFATATAWTDLLWILRGVWISLVGTVDWKRLVRHRGKVLLTDLVIIELAWLGANLLRFEGVPEGRYWSVYVEGIWLIPLVVLSVMMAGGTYRGLLRHFCSVDAVRLAVTGVVGWAWAYLILMVVENRSPSFEVGIIGTVLTLVMIGTERILHRERSKLAADPHGGPHREDDKTSVAVIYGAGRRGVALANLLDQGFTNVTVAGFLNDNPGDLAGRHIGGYRALGSERDLDTVHAVHGMSQLWMTFEPNRYKYLRLREWCENNDVQLIVLPFLEPFMTLCLPSGMDLSSVSLDFLEDAQPTRSSPDRLAVSW